MMNSSRSAQYNINFRPVWVYRYPSNHTPQVLVVDGIIQNPHHSGEFQSDLAARIPQRLLAKQDYTGWRASSPRRRSGNPACPCCTNCDSSTAASARRRRRLLLRSCVGWAAGSFSERFSAPPRWHLRLLCSSLALGRCGRARRRSFAVFSSVRGLVVTRSTQARRAGDACGDIRGSASRCCGRGLVMMRMHDEERQRCYGAS